MVYHFTLACLLVKNSGAGKTKKHTVMLCNQNCKAKKNDSRIQETTVTRLTQKRLSTTIVQHLALNLSPGPTKKSPGICKPDTTLWYQPIRNICNGQIGSWNPKDPGWTFKKNNSWVATTQDTTRFFSSLGPKARGVNMNIEMSRLASIDLGASRQGQGQLSHVF